MMNTPLYTALTTEEHTDGTGIDSTAILYRNETRRILTSWTGYKTVDLVQLAYRNQQVCAMLPSPQEQLPSTKVWGDWSLLTEGEKCGYMISSGESWYPRLYSLVKDYSGDSVMEFNMNYPSCTITFRGKTYTVTLSKFSTNTLEGVDYSSYSVQWPYGFDIDAAIMVQDGVTIFSLNVPGIEVDYSSVAEALKTSESVLKLLEDEGMTESFFVADTDEEMVSIAVLALYNSWHGRGH